MTEITLYNTKTRTKERFQPLDPDHVKMYVCGPTVYDRAHIGNARPVVVFDTLYRLLRHAYPRVTYVRNFTDVDDKINARATAEGRPIAEITAETTEWYLGDMAAIGALEPDEMPRATGYIPQMVAMIEGLIDRGHAYAAEGHVLFRVRSYSEYGALSGRSVDDMIAGARVEVAPYKEDPLDFVLWKPSDAATPGWDSPWGRGRPGWHIECSAMAHDLLGETFDIHGGGNDLQFPHHENEIAQSRCMGHGFAQVWMHNEMLQVEGKKMSKSLGNFFTVRDLLDQGVPGEVIRFVFLSTHYRKPMDWTEKKRQQAERTLSKWRTLCFGKKPAKQVPDKIVECVSDDLNTVSAMFFLRQYARDGRAEELLAGARFIGLMTDELSNWFDLGRSDLGSPKLNKILALRQDLRRNKQWADADKIRELLLELEAVVADSKDASAGYIDSHILLNKTMNALAEAYRMSPEGGGQLEHITKFAEEIGIRDPLPNGKLRAWSQREAEGLEPWVDARLDDILRRFGLEV